MGSPLSPIIADITLQDVELIALNKISYKLPIYLRYVNDILLAVPTNQILNLLEVFNSIHDRIKFTHEIAEDGCLSFLDITISKQHNSLIGDWYQKPTFSGRYLNFLSQNPISHKKGVINSLTDRAIILSHHQFHDKNIRKVINILLSNNYPLQLIFDTINKRLGFLFSSRLNGKRLLHNTNEGGENVRFFVLPYVSSITDTLRNTVNNNNKDIKFGYRNIRQLSSFIRTHKDRTPHLDRRNVVYCISCGECDCTYVGQTGRKLQTRVKEHRRNVLNNKNQVSVLAEHALNTGHAFEWDKIAVLDVAPSYHKRIMSEMLNIKLQKNSINIMQDTEALNNLYLPILDKLKH